MKSTIAVATLGAIFSGGVFAGTLSDSSGTYDSWLRVLTLSVGPAWANGGESQTFFLQPGIENTYSASKKSNSLASGELFYGLQHTLKSHFTGQLGLAVALAGSAKLQGDIWEDADPDFNNFFYNYKVNHARVVAKGKVITTINPIIQPYISASLGVGYNHASSFNNTPKIFEEIPTPDFGNNTTTSFSWTIGAGFGVPINDKWQIAVGYELADWGRSRLDTAPRQTVNSGLGLNHLYTNQLQCGLSYLA